MEIKQIYALCNSIKSNSTGTGTNVVDVSTFVDYGNEVLSSEANKEYWFNTLCDRIGRTLIAIRAYSGSNSDIMVSEFEFGNVLQKISYALQDAQANSDYVTQGENPYTLTAKGGVVQNLFVQNLPTYAFEDVIPNSQINNAFTSPQALGAFINGLYQRMYNAMEVSKEGLNIYAKNALFAKVYTNQTNAAYRVRKVLSEYNLLTDQELTADEAKTDKDFLYWLRRELKNARIRLTRMNTIYNQGTVERFTPLDKLHFDLSLDWASAYEQFYSNIYNEEFVTLPNYKERVDWGQLTNPERIAVTGLSGEESEQPTVINNVIGMMYDEDAVVTTFANERTVTIADQWNNRTPIKQTADRRYIVDISENAIVWVCE